MFNQRNGTSNSYSETVLQLLTKISNFGADKINIICWEEFTDETTDEILYQCANLFNVIFPPYKYSKLFHIHLQTTGDRTDLVSNLILKHGHQGAWAGITPLGGTQGVGHASSLKLMTHLASRVYTELKSADTNSTIDDLTSLKLIGIDLSTSYHSARYVYKLTDDKQNWPPIHCPFLGQDLRNLDHTVFDSRADELAMYGIHAVLRLNPYMEDSILDKERCFKKLIE